MKTRWLTAGLCTLLLCACEFQLDTERNAPERGTLGEEIHRILKQDLDRMKPKKGLAFGREQDRFVRAFDTLMPDAMLDDLQAYLVAILPLYDDQVLPGTIRPTACILQALSQNSDFLRALWYAGHPEGYGQDTHSPVLRRMLAKRETPDLLEHLGELWLANDGLDASLVPGAENDTFVALQRELARKMRDSTIDEDPDASAVVAIDFLLSEDGRLATGQGAEHWMVKTDLRGRALAAVEFDQVVEPFVDQDLDGLADIHPLTGDYVDSNGETLDVPPPFQPDGSRSLYQGSLIYQYSDLRQSMLGALVDQLEPLIQDGFLWELPDALPSLLGPIVARADEDGTFPGYEPEDSPVVALAHAGLVLLDYDRLPELLEVLLTVTELREPQMARMLHEFDLVGTIVDNYDHLSLAENNRLLDDLVPHLLESAEAGCMLPFLQSFSDPRSPGLQAGLADMIRYRDHLDYEVPGGMEFHILTDFTLSDSTYTNRSNLQKMMHLTRDTNGAEHATDIAGFDIFSIPDMLVFWLDSAADTGDPNEGLSHVPWYVVAAVEQFTTEYPPVEEVNRFMNFDHTILGNPAGHEGYELLNYNAESLLALETSGMLEALKPGITANAYCRRGESRSGVKIFADLLGAVHQHYSVNVPNSSSSSANLRVLEPMLLDIMDNTEVVTRVTELVGSLDGMVTSSGLSVLGELDSFTRFFLTPDPTILRHDGRNWVYGGDEVTQISPFSRLYLLIDAMRIVDDAVAGDPAADAALERTAELLGDRFLEVEEVEGVWRFKNRRAWFLFLNTISFFEERMRKHRDAGILSEKIEELEDDLRDLVGGRVTPQAVTAFELIADHPDLPNELDAITLDILDSSDPEWVRTVRKNVAWLIQDTMVDRVMVPVAQAVAPHIDPDGENGQRLDFNVETGLCLSFDPADREDTRGQLVNPILTRAMNLVVRMAQTQVPNRDVFTELLLNAATLAAVPDGFPLHDFGETIASLHREDPEQTGEKSMADLANILFEVSDYLLDDERGLEKLYQQVCRRNGGCF